MFTWNFQYISKARLQETLEQLALDSSKGDILVRIHTGAHLEDEAVEIARFIKKRVPGAKIFGTSTSAIINMGKLSANQCVISVTQASSGAIRTALFSTFDEETGEPLAADTLCEKVKEEIVGDDTKLLLTFLTGKYMDVYEFVDRCNDYFPGVQMIGGLANTAEISLRDFGETGFLFDENGWTRKGIILASIGGEEVESVTGYATGVEVLGDEIEITNCFGNCILEFEGKDAAESYRKVVGDTVQNNLELTNLFPFVYSGTEDIPIMVHYSKDKSIDEMFGREDAAYKKIYDAHPDIDTAEAREVLIANHGVKVGNKIKRAFIYDGKIISDNRSLFHRIEKFDKAETIFGYSCIARSVIYSNCVKWELSVYEESNICGCITEGEIAHVNGRNTFANCSFVISAFGEKEAVQKYNPHIFSNTEGLAYDNEALMNYLIDMERVFAEDKDQMSSSSMSMFVRDCEMKLLYSHKDKLLNSSAMRLDIDVKGYDRLCIIDVPDLMRIRTVFSEGVINITYKDFINKCSEFSKKKYYHIYSLSEWQIAIGAPSYAVSLDRFTEDMELLQRKIFESGDDYVSIVPTFCIIDGCKFKDLRNIYDHARIEMMQKNIQFIVYESWFENIDEKKIREEYKMLNIINYALNNDRVIPYYQGIYDNKAETINHYESLMRLTDENGRIYRPGEFLDVARKYGLLYDRLSRRMIEKVFDRFRDEEDVSVSINLGMRDIMTQNLLDYIYDFLSTTAYPENFVFEILENEDIDDYDRVADFIGKIHHLGAKVSLDDFGSGFSNLQHVINIDFDYVKIDGSIVSVCTENQDAENLIAIISGWKDISKNDVKIIAEYVENEEIQKLLISYKIDYSQGFLFSKPAEIIAKG
ncbi:MAG: EAL domain-containing protein [Eubacterium sp.]|nr:EAL domain-containing protein [Eubacterium sp.]